MDRIEMGTRIRELLLGFKLPTFAKEAVRRFQGADQETALPTLLELLEAEQSRANRRLGWLGIRRESSPATV